MLVIVILMFSSIMLIKLPKTKFENVSKFTGNSGRIKNWRVSTVGQYRKQYSPKLRFYPFLQNVSRDYIAANIIFMLRQIYMNT